MCGAVGGTVGQYACTSARARTDLERLESGMEVEERYTSSTRTSRGRKFPPLKKNINL